MQQIAKSWAWENDENRFMCGEVFMRSDDCSDLARDSARLQETLMDGVLQKLLVIVGHGCVSAASTTLVADRHLKH